MQAIFDATLKSVIVALDSREVGTADHSERCALYARVIAEEMGLPPDEIAHISSGFTCTTSASSWCPTPS